MVAEIYFCKMHNPIDSRIPKKHVLAAFLVFLLAGCASNDRVLTKEYAHAKFSDKTLFVFFPDSGAVEVLNPHDVSRCFPRENPIDAKALLAEEFDSAFFESLGKHADYVRLAPGPDTIPPPPDSQRISFSQPENLDLPAFTYMLPSRAWLSAHGVEADLGLYVQSLRSKVVEVLVQNPKIGAIHETSLVVEGRYILWDYAKNLPVAYGRFRPDVGTKGDVDTRDWMKAFNKAGRQVVERSPFKGEKWLKLTE